MTQINYEEIKSKFVQRLADRRFLGKEYAIYLYSLFSNGASGNRYELRLDTFGYTSKFHGNYGFPLPNTIGETRKVKFEKYQLYSFGRGGEIISCATLYNDEPDLKNSEVVSDPKHWEDKVVYFAGFQLANSRLVIFMVFQDPPHTIDGTQLEFIYLNSVLRSVEDIYHKNQIFNNSYLDLLEKHINKRVFSVAHTSIGKIIRYDYRYSRYLLKMYYKFIFENFRMFDGKLSEEHKQTFLKLTHEFEINQKNLFRIPNYRDHFLHQSNVYLIGMALVSILSKEDDIGLDLLKVFNCAYRQMEGDKYRDYIDISLTWFIASLFHDIAYPIEKSGQWMDAFFKEYIYPREYQKNILKMDLNISSVLSDRSFSQCIEDLSEFHRQLHQETKKIGYKRFRQDEIIRKACEIRRMIIDQIIDFRDHGVLSSIMLLNRFDRKNDIYIFKYLFPAAAAISIHNFIWINKNNFSNPCRSCRAIGKGCKNCSAWKTAYDNYFQNSKLRYIDFEKDPTGFLLILCDTLQDWGRYDFENLGLAFERYYNQSRISNISTENSNGTKAIVIDLQLSPGSSSGSSGTVQDFMTYKKQEIVKVFSRLKFLEKFDIIVRLKKPKSRAVEFSMNSFR